MASTTPAAGAPPEKCTRTKLTDAVPPLPWLHLLAPPPATAVGSTVTVCTSGGAICHLPAEFVSACTTINVMLEDADAGDVLPLTSVDADELSHLVCAFSTATEHRAEVWTHLSTQQVATCLRASAFLGLEEIRGSAVSHLARRLHGLDVASMRAACEADASDSLTPAQQDLVEAMLNKPSVEALAIATASLAEAPSGGGAGCGVASGAVLGLDWDSALTLLGTMDLRDLGLFLSSSRSACCLLFSPGFDEGTMFKAWAATLIGRHPALSSVFSSIVAAAQRGEVASRSTGEGAERLEVAAVWSEQMEQMFSLWNVLCWLEDHSNSGRGGTEDPAGQYAWLLSWVRQQSMCIGTAPTAADSRRRLRSVPLSLLSNCVYLLSTLKSPYNHAEELYALATETVAAATDTSGQRLSILTSGTTAPVIGAEGAQPNLADAAAEPTIPVKLGATLDAEWRQLLSVHNQLIAVFGHLHQHYTVKHAVPGLEAVCRESRDRSDAWQHTQSTWRWSAPDEAAPPEPPPVTMSLLLIFTNKSTLRVTVRQLEGCQTLLTQLATDQAYAAQSVGRDQVGPFLLVTGCSRVAMIKLIEFIEGIAAAAETGEDDLTFIQAYKRSMEAQEQLPLLFQTMTAANMVGHKRLLNELTKMVAEMIESRTPEEIQDFFNIKTSATWEEEVELMRQHAVRSL